MKLLKSTPTQLSFVKPASLKVQLIQALVPVGFASLVVGSALYWAISTMTSSEKTTELTCRRVEPTLVSCQLEVPNKQDGILKKSTIQPLNRAEVVTAEGSDENGKFYTCYVVLYNRTGYDPNNRFPIPIEQFFYRSNNRSCEAAKGTAEQINSFIRDSQSPAITFSNKNRPSVQQLWQTMTYWWVGITLGLFLLIFVPQALTAQAELWIFDKDQNKLIVKQQRLLKAKTSEYPLQDILEIQLIETTFQGTDEDGDVYQKVECEVDLQLLSDKTLIMHSINSTFYQGNLTANRKRIDKIKKKLQVIVDALHYFLNLPVKVR